MTLALALPLTAAPLLGQALHRAVLEAASPLKHERGAC